MKWLENVMMPKFYRYMYHKMVILSTKCRESEPYSSCVVAMAITLCPQILAVLFILSYLLKYDIVSLVMGSSRSSNIITLIIFGYFNYILFYYKGKYIRIMEEFKNETPKQTNVGIIYLIIYIILCAMSYGIIWLLEMLFGPFPDVVK